MNDITSTQTGELAFGYKLTSGGINDPLLTKLLHAINNADEIEISVSFIQLSGISLLLSALEDALNRQASIKILTSDYLCITDPRALKQLMLLVDRGAETKIYQCKANESFHMKSFIFVKVAQDKIVQGCAFVGSNNISKAALTHAHEWCLRYDYQLTAGKSDPDFYYIRSQFAAIFNHEQAKKLTHYSINEYQGRYAKQKKSLFTLVANNAELESFEAFAPNDIQQQALSALNETRELGYQRGLVVLATGMGKTWLAAFDAKQCLAKSVLFVAHREEILLQAQATFSLLMNEVSTGLYNGKETNKEAKFIFASVQTLGQKGHLTKFNKKHFDYIIVDEFHHASAPVYQQLLAHFQPKFLLGLTATPERSDQADILSLADNNLVFERNLVHGIEANILAPFDYHGIYDDSVDYQEIPWRNGKFDPSSINNALATTRRADHILKHWSALKQTRTLAFCISKQHADFMAKKFINKGFKAVAVYSDSKVKRNEALTALANGELDVLFSVDMFNEGTDIPAIDTILMIRPSESKILFLQQLGRGLRLSPKTGKTNLTVLDFIGNHHSFLNKPLALFGEQGTKRILRGDQSGALPVGCHVNIPLELINFWQSLENKIKLTSQEEFVLLSEQLGHRATATEFFLQGYDLAKVRKQQKSWFNLVAQNLPDNVENQRVKNIINHFHEFLLEGIEKTSMSKCFKPILLEAFLELNGFKYPPTTQQLAERSWLVLKRRPDLFNSELPEKQKHLKASEPAWHRYWKNNPINAFVGNNKAKITPWFTVEEGVFIAKVTPNELEIDVLHQLMQELVDFRLAQYIHKKARTSKSTNIKTDFKPVLPAQANGEEEIVSSMQENVISIPYYPNLKIACGHFKQGMPDDLELMSLPLDIGNFNAERHFIAPASGNSMNGGKNPIMDGELLLLEWVTPTSAGSISNTTMAIERLDMAGDAEYLLRVIKKQADGKYLLHANNPDYDDQIATSEMKTFARLIKVVRQ